MRLLDDEPELPLTINIVPLIDVMFALLTFFIMSTLFLTRSQGLPVNLPKAATGQVERPAQVTVTINKTGQMFLDKQAISIEQLENGVRQKVQPQQQMMVVINADEGVSHGQVVAVMDKVRRVDGAKLAIATQKP
ncbi:MAG: biopolymer transporter ExbD [Brasilonema angustatum HA4187-MV1]|jgi:biopolymer transport protein ExbD|nr:biopolymer transporter ExbD [Brasilonema angustatum HA4187-MV1]